MASTRVPRSVGLCFLLALGLGVAAVLALPVPGARATSGATGPVTVTVTPTAGLEDGQVVAIKASTGTSGVKLISIVAHICAPNAHIKTDVAFGSDGGKCPGAVGNPGGGTGEASVTAAGASSLPPDPAHPDPRTTFRAGIGTVDWTSFGSSDPAKGTARTLTCDQMHACDLVVKLLADGGTDYFFTAPLTYAGAGGLSSNNSSTTSSTSTTTSAAVEHAAAAAVQSGVAAAATTTPSTTTSTTTASGTTTTTIPCGTTTTTTPSGTTTTTTPSGTTTTTTTSGTTTTTAASGTTTTTIPCGTTTTTTASGTTTTLAGTATTLSGTTVTTTPSGGTLPLTGNNSRDLASAALLMIAIGLFLLGRYYKGQPGR